MGKYGISYRRTITSEFSQWGSSITGLCLDKLERGRFVHLVRRLYINIVSQNKNDMRRWSHLLGTRSWSSLKGRAIWNFSSSLKNCVRWLWGKDLLSARYFSTCERWTTPLGGSNRPQLFSVSFYTGDRQELHLLARHDTPSHNHTAPQQRLWMMRLPF